jgi:hypothetical protein
MDTASELELEEDIASLKPMTGISEYESVTRKTDANKKTRHCPSKFAWDTYFPI